MTDVAVSVRGLGKRYRIAHQRDPYGRLTETLAGALRAPLDRVRGKPRETEEWFWALQDVSFDLKVGDVLGVIGRNGAGKSTLLKILSRITEPTTGVAELRGRVGSLLEVGTGFHPELTGRENVLMSGAVLGMRRADIIRRFDEIVEFSGIEQFLDTPVKRYSSGMQVRLGFAVAAHLEPEILLVDEVLAVGDLAFQEKCIGKMSEVAGEGRTVLFVSHNMAAIEALCADAVLFERSRVVASGSTAKVTEQYVKNSNELASAPIAERHDRRGSGDLQITDIEWDLQIGRQSTLSFGYQSHMSVRSLTISVGIFTLRGEGVAYLSNEMSGDKIGPIPPTGRLSCTFDTMAMLPGRYKANVHCVVNGVLADWVVDAVVIDVKEGDYFGTGRLPSSGYGSVVVSHRWAAEPAARVP